MWHSSRDMRHVILNWSNLEIYFPKSTPSAQSLFWKSSLIKNHKTWCKKNLIHPKHYVLIFYEYHQQLNLTQFDFTLLDLILPKPVPTRAKYFRTEIWPDFTWTRTDMKWSWPIFTLFKPMTHELSWAMGHE